jgi:hypothetical protein
MGYAASSDQIGNTRLLFTRLPGVFLSAGTEYRGKVHLQFETSPRFWPERFTLGTGLVVQRMMNVTCLE